GTQRQMRGHPASVLILIGLSRSRPGDSLQILITKRSEEVPSHQGQMALPGGVRNLEDLDEVQTALRETKEEVGICPAAIEVIGKMPPAFTLTSGFEIAPVVGMLKSPIEEVSLKICEKELADAFWIELGDLES